MGSIAARQKINARQRGFRAMRIGISPGQKTPSLTTFVGTKKYKSKK